MKNRPNKPALKLLLSVIAATSCGEMVFADAVLVDASRSVTALALAGGNLYSETHPAWPIFADFNATANASASIGNNTPSDDGDDAAATATSSQKSSLTGSLLQSDSSASASAGAGDLSYAGFNVGSSFNVLFTIPASHTYQLSGLGVFNSRDDLAQAMVLALSKVNGGGMEVPIHDFYETQSLSVAESGVLSAGTYRLSGGFEFGGPHPTGGSMNLGFSLQLTEVPDASSTSLSLGIALLAMAAFNRRRSDR